MEKRSILGIVRTSCFLLLLPAVYAACGGDSFTQSEGGAGGSGTGGTDTGGTGGALTGGTGGEVTGGTGGEVTGGTGGEVTGGTGGEVTGGTGGGETGGTGGVETGGTGGGETGGTGGGETGGTGGGETGGTGGGETGGTGGGCDIDQKWCDDTCVGIDDPHFGCDAATCDPCALPNVATHDCGTTGCIVVACEPGWGDCDAAQPGCEQDLTDMNHCGECNQVCAVPDNGSATCDNGICTITCDSPYSVCEGACELVGMVVEHCLGCGKACPPIPNAELSCASGECGFSCLSGFTNCNDGCVSFSTDSKNCGWCGHDCGPGSTCSNGYCSPQVLYTSVGQLIDLAVDPGDTGDIFWAEAGGSGSAVKHRAKTSASGVSDVTSNSLITTLAVDGTHLFVGANDQSILRKSRSLSSPPDLHITTSGTPLDLHQNDAAIGWAQTSADPGIFTALKTTGVVTREVTAPAGVALRFPQLEPISKTLYYAGLSSAGTSSSYIDVHEDNGATAGEHLAVDLPLPGGLAMNGDFLFWTLPSVGKVHKVAKVNPGTPDVIATTTPDVKAIEADGEFIAWAQDISLASGGKIFGRYGTVNRALAQGEQSVCAIALDKNYVYWINCKAQGSVKRVAR